MWRGISLLPAAIIGIIPLSQIKSQEFKSSLRTAFQNCAANAISNANFRKVWRGDGYGGKAYEIVLTCDQQVSKAFWIELGQSGFKSSPWESEKKETGSARWMGESVCINLRESANGDPMDRYICQLAFDVGKAFKDQF